MSTGGGWSALRIGHSASQREQEQHRDSARDGARTQVIDLMEALKASLARKGAAPAAAAAASDQAAPAAAVAERKPPKRAPAPAAQAAQKKRGKR